MNRFLVTGCAGFIGFHVAERLLANGDEVIGIDNFSPYYDEGLKAARLKRLQDRRGFLCIRMDMADRSCMQALFRDREFGPIIHLAAQAGVRYSLENPHLYIDTNIVGFVNLLEEARNKQTPHLVFASSSSVYGANKKTPFSEHDNVDHPVSLYAATKKSNELLAHVYAHLYQLPVTGLRFFTVYGPWGRPDMAMFKFCKAILAGTPIELYNHGAMMRDFTYIDDIVEGVIRTAGKVPGDSNSCPDHEGSSRYRIFNIGNNRPVELTTLISVLEKEIGRKAVVKPMPMQPGDVPLTYADIDELVEWVGYRPYTPIERGVANFVAWYREFYGV